MSNPLHVIQTLNLFQGTGSMDSQKSFKKEERT